MHTKEREYGQSRTKNVRDMDTLGIVVIGCGNISGIYIQNLQTRFKNTKVVGLYSRNIDRAERIAAENNIHRTYKNYGEALEDSDVSVILNLTPPAVHYDVTKQALQKGKHVYSEKPLAATFEQGKRLAELAEKNNVLLCCAPDTILGGALQSSLHYLRDDIIGDVFGASAFLQKRGVENWHPNPTFLYQDGGGPMMDMGPYYLSALIKILRSVEKVAGMSSIPMPTRVIRSGLKAGESFQVTVPTYANALLQFASGVIGNIMTTFDSHQSELPHLEIYGSKGTLTLPDPNTFGGSIKVYRDGQSMAELPLLYQNTENCRGIGLSDMITAIHSRRKAALEYHLALHVLEIIEAIEASQQQNQYVYLKTKYEET